jgi:hypothetical protein
LTDDEIIAAYIKLFRGRADVYGNFTNPCAIREPLTPDHFRRHLCSPQETDWIGVYPHLGGTANQSCTWGCIDIDGKDFDHDWDAMWALATKLRTVLAVKDIYAHTERTRNGYHLWVFPDTPFVPAVHMRRALMAACKAVAYDPKEVNPKSEELAPGKVGNWVRLPYPGALSDDGWSLDRGEQAVARMFVNECEDFLQLPDFLDSAKYTSREALAAIAALWTPPVKQTFDGPPPEDVENILPLLSGKAFTIWRDGPLEGRDRSNTLAKLAYTLAADGLQMPAAFAVVRDADRRWGKFADRPDCDEQIMRFIERAYSS